MLKSHMSLLLFLRHLRAFIEYAGLAVAAPLRVQPAYDAPHRLGLGAENIFLADLPEVPSPSEHFKHLAFQTT